VAPRDVSGEVYSDGRDVSVTSVYMLKAGRGSPFAPTVAFMEQAFGRASFIEEEGDFNIGVADVPLRRPRVEVNAIANPHHRGAGGQLPGRGCEKPLSLRQLVAQVCGLERLFRRGPTVEDPQGSAARGECSVGSWAALNAIHHHEIRRAPLTRVHDFALR